MLASSFQQHHKLVILKGSGADPFIAIFSQASKC